MMLEPLESGVPLAERLRPQTLEEILGQDAALEMMRAFVKQGSMPSVVFFGPPGAGKTTFSRLLARLLDWAGAQLNATSATVKEIRELAHQARELVQQTRRRTLLFVDEIHRLNKARQDVLLPFIEDGVFVLAGSTTENPAFALNRALRSRVQLIRLEPLDRAHIFSALQRALSVLDAEADDTALDWLAQRVSGDLRIAYTTLESAAALAQAEGAVISTTHVASCLNQAVLAGDRAGDNHYDLASAFQKSLRGSDAAAAIYYLARFLETGEDPRFIARRLWVTASEDVGNADPMALVLAGHAFRAVEVLGLPEARIALAQATLYVARAVKGRSGVDAIDAAIDLVRQRGADPIPIHLRMAHVAGDQSHADRPEARSGDAFLPAGVPVDRIPLPGPRPARGHTVDEDTAAMFKALREVTSEDDWFSVDAGELARRLDWPVERVKRGLNLLVKSGALHFRRSFKWNDG